MDGSTRIVEIRDIWNAPARVGTLRPHAPTEQTVVKQRYGVVPRVSHRCGRYAASNGDEARQSESVRVHMNSRASLLVNTRD